MAPAPAYDDLNMSDVELPVGNHPPRQIPGRREFICHAHVWTSSSKSSSLRKSTPQRKKDQKRDSLNQSTSGAQNDDSPTKKVRESRSWLNIARSSPSSSLTPSAYTADPASPNASIDSTSAASSHASTIASASGQVPPAVVGGSGYWRVATCKLIEQDLAGSMSYSATAGNTTEASPIGAVLNIYAEDTLQHSVFIHLLRNTDIRPVDRSLFFRPDCLVIHHNTPGQPFSPTLPSHYHYAHAQGYHTPHAPLTDSTHRLPIYLLFPHSEALTTWLSLLRSYARPEVYGVAHAPAAQGGLYRMWRQVEMSVLAGRGLGVGRGVSMVVGSGSAGGALGGGGGSSSTGGGWGWGFGGDAENEGVMLNLRSGVTASSVNVGSTVADNADPGGVAGAGAGGGAGSSSATLLMKEGAEMDVYCEISVDGEVCGRTTVKRTSVTSGTPSTSSGSTSVGDSFGVGGVSNSNSGNNIGVAIASGDPLAATSTTSPITGLSSTSSSYPLHTPLPTATTTLPTHPSWHESFTIPDLPPCNTLTVSIWRDRKLFKPVLIGSAEIWMGGLRRGEWVEGWWNIHAASVNVGGPGGGGIGGGVKREREDSFGEGDAEEGSEAGLMAGVGPGAGYPGPVMQGVGPGALPKASLIIGEIKLKIKFDEEIIMPSETYSRLLSALENRNYLELLSELENKVQPDHIAHHVLSLAHGRNVLFHDLCEFADREIESCSSPTTLFRGNSTFTKALETTMNIFGRPFLEASIGPVVRRMCSERVMIEIDPGKLAKGTKELDVNVRTLVYWCEQMWGGIWNSRGECPHEIRKIFQYIRQRVDKKFPKQDSDSRYQSVSAFCFLRFINPAILHPHMNGICPGFPSPSVQNSLKHVARIIQSLANLNLNVNNQEYMRSVKDFIVQNIAAMIDYIVVVSSPVPDKFGPFPTPPDKHDRLHAMNTLRERLPHMPVLYRESVPMVPHALDLPKHLAVITSTIVRNARDIKVTAQTATSSPGRLSDFTRICYEIETTALKNVTRLAPSSYRSSRKSAREKGHLPRSSSAAGMADLTAHSSYYSALSPSSPTSPTMMTFRRPAADSFSSGSTTANHAMISTGAMGTTPSLPVPPGRKKKSSRPSTAPSSTGSVSTDSQSSHPTLRTGAVIPTSRPGGSSISISTKDLAMQQFPPSSSTRINTAGPLTAPIQSPTRTGFDFHNASTAGGNKISSSPTIHEGVPMPVPVPTRPSQPRSTNSLRSLSVTPPSIPQPSPRRPSTASGMTASSIASPSSPPMHSYVNASGSGSIGPKSPPLLRTVSHNPPGGDGDSPPQTDGSDETGGKKPSKPSKNLIKWFRR